MNREQLLEEYIYPIFQDKDGAFIETDSRITLFSNSLYDDEISYTGRVFKSLTWQFAKRFRVAPEDRKNIRRDYETYNSKQKQYFEELIEIGEVYKAAMVYYTQKVRLPQTKKEVLSEFDRLLEDKLIIKCSQDTWIKIKGTLHKILKYKSDELPYEAIKYMFDEDKKLTEFNIIEKLAHTIYKLLTPMTIAYHGSSTFTKFDIDDLWEHEDLKNILI